MRPFGQQKKREQRWPFGTGVHISVNHRHSRFGGKFPYKKKKPVCSNAKERSYPTDIKYKLNSVCNAASPRYRTS